MKYLLDTHTFIWWILDTPKLSDLAKNIISDKENSLFLSSASAWEIVIKSSIGKLSLPESPKEFIRKQLHLNSIKPLNLTFDHTFELIKLPMIHKDPFDRILVAQANSENLTIITDDPLIKQYEVKVLTAKSL